MLFKKLYKTLVISAFTLFMGLSTPAVQAYEVDNCCDWNPCCFDYGLNPPPTCPTCCGCTWYGAIEYIYWKPCVDNAPAAFVVQSDDLPVSSASLTESNTVLSKCFPKDFKFDWDSGFRVAVGYGFPCDKWGLSLGWTHYRTCDRKTLSGFGTYEGTTPLFFSGIMPIPPFVDGFLADRLGLAEMGQLESTWDFQFNQVDLDLFRNFYVGCSLSLKPYVGLRALFIKNHLDSMSSYEVNDTGAISQLNFESVTIDQRLKSDFKSVGLKAGLESFWEAFCGIGVYGDIGASALYACYETDHKFIQTATTTGAMTVTDAIRTQIPHKWETLKLMTDLSLGIQWRQLINCNQNMLVVKLGWEHHMIFRSSVFSSVSRGAIPGMGGSIVGPVTCKEVDGNISLYGFVASISYSF